jgi:mannose-6-phosphate isomerase
MMNYYPLKFEPILKKVIWGGNQICGFKHLNKVETGIGESWEISQVPGSVSTVSNGSLKGKNLSELIETDPKNILGKKSFEKYGPKFPLLIKFIDARDDLSIQVHPDDKLAKLRHNSFGKTEMWYVIQSEPGAKLISGFSKEINAEEYEKRILDGTIEDVLQSHATKEGDVFFIPAGRIHAIGKGLFITEIQQTSDITYRLYDYKRKDANGNERELHTSLAKDAIDYNIYKDLKVNYTDSENDVVKLAECDYFVTNKIHLKSEEIFGQQISFGGQNQNIMVTDTIEMERDFTGMDCFRAYICISGKGSIDAMDNGSVQIHQGETVLIPACIENVTLNTNNELILLETYLP